MKKYYQKPELEKIQLDKQISLVMMSVPPGDPDIGKAGDNGIDRNAENRHFA